MLIAQGLGQDETSAASKFIGGTAVFLLGGTFAGATVALEYEYSGGTFAVYEPSVLGAVASGNLNVAGKFQQAGVYPAGNYRVVSTGGDGTTDIDAELNVGNI